MIGRDGFIYRVQPDGFSKVPLGRVADIAQGTARSLGIDHWAEIPVTFKGGQYTANLFFDAVSTTDLLFCFMFNLSCVS